MLAALELTIDFLPALISATILNKVLRLIFFHPESNKIKPFAVICGLISVSYLILFIPACLEFRWNSSGLDDTIVLDILEAIGLFIANKALKHELDWSTF